MRTADAARRRLLLQTSLPLWLRLSPPLWLSACAVGGRSTAPAASVPPPATAPPTSAGGLVVEARWLRSWFDGTPVRIEPQRDAGLLVEVPRDFCFDAGSTGIKPPLAAVLDKVAESLRRCPQAVVSTLAVPEESGRDPRVAARAAQVREYLRQRGVHRTRTGGATEGSSDALRLHISPGPDTAG